MANEINYYPSEYGGEAPDSSLLGSYQYINLDDMINNFMFEKTGEDSVLGTCNRNKVAYHIQRSIQMLNYDTIRVTRQQSLEVNPETNAVALPHDFVNIVGIYTIELNGQRRPILLDTRVASGQEIMQRDDFTYEFTDDGDLLEVSPSISINRFQSNDDTPISVQSYFFGSGFNDYESPYTGGYYKRYGLNPSDVNVNGRYSIDTAKGVIYLSGADYTNIMIDYITDGLYDDGEIKVNKMAEEAVYRMAEYKILSNKSLKSVTEYQLRRVKHEADTEMRNAKIRFMNLNMADLKNTFRNQAKWIKH